MSAWPIPDEVVDDFVYFADLHPCDECGGEYPCRHHREEVRERLERHRLVQLPEEPAEWEYEADDRYNGGGLRWFVASTESRGRGPEEDARWLAVSPDTAKEASTGRIRPVYRIPGQPITVEKEERERDG